MLYLVTVTVQGAMIVFDGNPLFLAGVENERMTLVLVGTSGYSQPTLHSHKPSEMDLC